MSSREGEKGGGSILVLYRVQALVGCVEVDLRPTIILMMHGEGIEASPGAGRVQVPQCARAENPEVSALVTQVKGLLGSVRVAALKDHRDDEDWPKYDDGTPMCLTYVLLGSCFGTPTGDGGCGLRAGHIRADAFTLSGAEQAAILALARRVGNGPGSAGAGASN